MEEKTKCYEGLLSIIISGTLLILFVLWLDGRFDNYDYNEYKTNSTRCLKNGGEVVKDFNNDGRVRMKFCRVPGIKTIFDN